MKTLSSIATTWIITIVFAAINSWCAATGREFGAFSWEIYGDWAADETKLETQVIYLLR